MPPPRKLPKVDSEVAKLHMEIHIFLSDLIKQDQSNLNPFAQNTFIATSAYAEAVLKFRKEGINPDKWFYSCDDPILLKYASQLKDKFKVAALSWKEGMEREKNYLAEGQPVERTWCAGSPMFSKEYHQGAEIGDQEWFSRKPKKRIGPN